MLNLAAALDCFGERDGSGIEQEWEGGGKSHASQMELRCFKFLGGYVPLWAVHHKLVGCAVTYAVHH